MPLTNAQHDECDGQNRATLTRMGVVGKALAAAEELDLSAAARNPASPAADAVERDSRLSPRAVGCGHVAGGRGRRGAAAVNARRPPAPSNSVDAAQHSSNAHRATISDETSSTGRGLARRAAAERLYIYGVPIGGETTFPTLRAVADRVGASVRAVEGWASQGEWTKRRAAFLASVAREHERTRRAEMLREAEQFDKASLTVAKSTMQLVLRRFRQVTLEQEHQPQRVMDADELVRLTAAAEKAQKIGRLVLNMPTTGAADGHHEQTPVEELHSFLDPSDARRLRELEVKIDHGEADVMELYRTLGRIFDLEQQRHAALPPRPKLPRTTR